jgi:hypothetical protein
MLNRASKRGAYRFKFLLSYGDMSKKKNEEVIFLTFCFMLISVA